MEIFNSDEKYGGVFNRIIYLIMLKKQYARHLFS